MERKLSFAEAANRVSRVFVIVGCFAQLGCESGPAPLSGEIAKTRIAFTESRNNALWMLNADGSGMRMLNADAHSTVKFSPDGSRLAFKTSNHVHVVTNLEGEIIYAFQGCYASDDFTWAPDGTAIVFGCYVDGIWRYALGDAAPVKLADSVSGTYDHDPAISPDGSRIIYTHNEYGVQYTIYMIDPNGGNRRLVGQGVSRHDAHNGMTWADGAHVFFTPLDGTIHFLDVDTLADTVTDTHVPDAFNAMRLNRQLSMIAIYGVMYIGLSPATGLMSGVISMREAPGTWGFIGTRGFAWSPDGTYYVAAGFNADAQDKGIVSVFDVSGTQYRFLKYGDFPSPQQPSYLEILGVDWAIAPN